MSELKIERLELFEGGDPAAPLGCQIRIYRDNREVCFIAFPNDENEDIQNLFEKALKETFGAETEWRSNMDGDYYHHSSID